MNEDGQFEFAYYRRMYTVTGLRFNKLRGANITNCYKRVAEVLLEVQNV
jgi:hypothetical protein